MRSKSKLIFYKLHVLLVFVQCLDVMKIDMYGLMSVCFPREQPFSWGVEVSSGQGSREVKTSYYLSDKSLVDHISFDLGNATHYFVLLFCSSVVFCLVFTCLWLLWCCKYFSDGRFFVLSLTSLCKYKSDISTSSGHAHADLPLDVSMSGENETMSYYRTMVSCSLISFT